MSQGSKGFSPISDADREAQMVRLRQAMDKTSVADVRAKFDAMVLQDLSLATIDTLVFALLLAVGDQNEKLGGHCIVSRKEAFSLLR